MNKWIISDTHFGHGNIIKFTGLDGSLIRPGFSCIEEHDELLVERWNAVVKKDDKVYHLGDVGGPLSILSRLNGKKTLILGNHDDRYDVRDLRKHFEKVRSWRVFDKQEFGYLTVFCHYPLHRSIDVPTPRRVCVHGHIHEKTLDDSFYINVCVEHTNMSPLSFDDLRSKIQVAAHAA